MAVYLNLLVFSSARLVGEMCVIVEWYQMSRSCLCELWEIGERGRKVDWYINKSLAIYATGLHMRDLD